MDTELYIGVRGNVYFTSFPAEGDVELFFRLLLATTGVQLSPSGFSASQLTYNIATLNSITLFTPHIHKVTCSCKLYIGAIL